MVMSETRVRLRNSRAVVALHTLAVLLPSIYSSGGAFEIGAGSKATGISERPTDPSMSSRFTSWLSEEKQVAIKHALSVFVNQLVHRGDALSWNEVVDVCAKSDAYRNCFPDGVEGLRGIVDLFEHLNMAFPHGATALPMQAAYLALFGRTAAAVEAIRCYRRLNPTQPMDFPLATSWYEGVLKLIMAAEKQKTQPDAEFIGDMKKLLKESRSFVFSHALEIDRALEESKVSDENMMPGESNDQKLPDGGMDGRPESLASRKSSTTPNADDGPRRQFQDLTRNSQDSTRSSQDSTRRSSQGSTRSSQDSTRSCQGSTRSSRAPVGTPRDSTRRGQEMSVSSSKSSSAESSLFERAGELLCRRHMRPRGSSLSESSSAESSSAESSLFGSAGGRLCGRHMRPRESSLFESAGERLCGRHMRPRESSLAESSSAESAVKESVGESGDEMRRLFAVLLQLKITRQIAAGDAIRAAADAIRAAADATAADATAAVREAAVHEAAVHEAYATLYHRWCDTVGGYGVRSGKHYKRKLAIANLYVAKESLGEQLKALSKSLGEKEAVALNAIAASFDMKLVKRVKSLSSPEAKVVEDCADLVRKLEKWGKDYNRVDDITKILSTFRSALNKAPRGFLHRAKAFARRNLARFKWNTPTGVTSGSKMVSFSRKSNTQSPSTERMTLRESPTTSLKDASQRSQQPKSVVNKWSPLRTLRQAMKITFMKASGRPDMPDTPTPGTFRQVPVQTVKNTLGGTSSFPDMPTLGTL